MRNQNESAENRGKAFPFFLSETLRALNSDMTSSQITSSHVASLLFFLFLASPAIALLLSCSKGKGRTEQREETQKVSCGISHPSRRLEFHCDSNASQEACFCKFAYFRNRFQRNVCTSFFFLSIVQRYVEFRRYAGRTTKKYRKGNRSGNHCLQRGTRCTIHPCGSSLSALRRLEILAALFSQ